MRMPTSKSGGARFRGPTSSQEYNRNEDDKYLELVELYRQSNLNKQLLREAYEIVLHENVTLNNYVEMLEARLVELEKQFKTLDSLNGQFTATSFVDNMKISYPTVTQDNSVTTPRAAIDLQYRFATLPLIHQIPKTHTVDKQNKVLIPSELKVRVGRTNTGGKVLENNVMNAFNGENESYWKREVVYPLGDAPSQEDVIVEIELPVALVNNLNVNTIQIHPHPERGIEITSIEVHYNDAWEEIKGFNQRDISITNSKEFSPRRKWYFPSKPVQRIRITMTQKHPIDLDGAKMFVLGAQEIGVFLSIFEPSGGFVLTPFDLTDVGVYHIESVEHVFLNRDAFSYDKNLDHLLENHLFQYEILVEDSGMLVPISNDEWQNQIAQKLWIKTHLLQDPEPSNGVNPCLHAVRLHYTKA